MLLLALPLALAETPRVDVSAGVGLPLLTHVDLRWGIDEQWGLAVGAGTGFELLYPGVEVGARWQPRALCAGAGGPVQAQGGLGVSLLALVHDPVPVVLSLDGELRLYGVGARGNGGFVGARAGIGPTADLGADNGKVEPSFNLVLLEGGAAFGRPRD